MVDLGVVVVGAAGQHDAVGVVLLDPPQGLVALAVHGVVEVHVCLPSGVDGLVDLGAGDVGATHAAAALGGVLLALLGDELVQATLELALLVVRDERVKELDLGALAKLVDVELERLRVAHDDGAVVVVGSLLVLLALPADAGHPDEVRVLSDEVHDVAVAELGRVADGLGGHGLDAGLVGLAVGLVGENDAEAQLGEERVPERIVLVHVEGARNAHGAAGGLLLGEHRAVKEQLVLVLKQVGGVALGALAGARALLAAVARDEAVPLAKVVDGQQAVVGAATAVDVGVLDLQVVDLLAGEQAGGAGLAGTVAGEKCGTVGAHAAGHVRTDDVAAGQKLEGAQRRIGHEGAALDHAVLADLVEVTQLDDLEQGVLDDGVGEACGHVTDGRALLLGLLDAGVHEDGAAGAQVDGARGVHGRLGELLDAHVHGHGEGLDEGAAAGGAGLVEHDVLDDAVLDLQALHVLAADVQDELNVGDEGLGAAQVRDGLDFSGVCAQGLDEDLLAVAGGGHVADGAVRGHLVVDVVRDGAGGAQDVAVVVAVPGVEKLAVLADDSRLHGG